MTARQKPAEPAEEVQDSPQWDEQVAVTGRPQDTPNPNSTFGTRGKAVQTAENKAIGKADTK